MGYSTKSSINSNDPSRGMKQHPAPPSRGTEKKGATSSALATALPVENNKRLEMSSAGPVENSIGNSRSENSLAHQNKRRRLRPMELKQQQRQRNEERRKSAKLLSLPPPSSSGKRDFGHTSSTAAELGSCATRNDDRRRESNGTTINTTTSTSVDTINSGNGGGNPVILGEALSSPRHGLHDRDGRGEGGTREPLRRSASSPPSISCAKGWVGTVSQSTVVPSEVLVVVAPSRTPKSARYFLCCYQYRLPRLIFRYWKVAVAIESRELLINSIGLATGCYV